MSRQKGDESALARAYVERLEEALAAATHERDLAGEKARLADAGVEQLQARLERTQRRVESTEGETQRAEQEVESARKEAEQAHKDAEQAHRETEQARAETEQARAETEQARAETEQSRREIEPARAETEQARAETERIGADVERLEAELAEARRALDNARTGVEARDRRLEVAAERLERERVALADLKARHELREQELERSTAVAEEARQELAALRDELGKSERELVASERDLAARVRELAQVGDELVGREKALAAAAEKLQARAQELDAAQTLLEAQGGELARARERERLASAERDEAEEQLQRAKEETERAKEETERAEEETERAKEETERAEAEISRAKAETGRATEKTERAEEEREQLEARLEAREQHLANAKAGIESRDRRLAAAERAAEGDATELSARDAEIERLRGVVRERERSLVLAEARLEKAQQRAEQFKGSLVELRSGRSYKLMRVLWRLRHPFRRASKQQPHAAPRSEPAAEEAESSSPVSVAAREGSASPPQHRLRVASILDEMSEACFAPECELVPMTLKGWARQLDEQPPHLLLVESAWNGNGGEWQYRIAQYPRADLAGLPALHELIEGCRERGIPTAFWNKEDPVHFDRFAEAAALFDHVFTTDARCVERYRVLPGEHERTVTPLPFAAQPRIHNPVAVVPERGSSPCFAGAWYRDRHPDRRRSLAALLDAARPYGLVIYDRSFDSDDGAFGFPDRFAPHVLGKLPYERILDVYKSHRVFLNANSVVDSPTMCSRRVFELAACDTAILSTPGAALGALLGEGTVDEAADEQSAAAALERLLGDEQGRRRRTRAARRRVLAEHTYADRLVTIAATAGLDVPQGEDEWQLFAQSGVELSAEARADLEAASIYAEADVIGVHPGNGAAPLEHRRVDELDPRVLLLHRNLIESRSTPTGNPDQIRTQLRRWSDEGVRLYAADADLMDAGTANAVVV